MNAEELAAIRERDAMVRPIFGVAEDAEQDRRALLAHIDALTAKVRELPEAATVTGAYYNCIDRAAVLAILRGEA